MKKRSNPNSLRSFFSGLLLLSVVFLYSMAHAKEDRYLYSRVRHFVRKHEIDFAFMGCQDIVESYPISKYRERCLFANGAYIFGLPNYEEAKSAFQLFVDEYPDSDGKIFALAYLHRIAVLQEDSQSEEYYRNEIINQKQLSLVFRDKEKYVYKSIFNSLYTANIYIDKIEFYVQGEILTNIFY